jgi:capsular polysaccharide biosynthesis protein
LQNRIMSQFASGNAHGTFIYLKRGRTGAPRLIENESEIIEVLTKNGFTIVDIASDSLQYIISSLMHAKLVLSVEGSHLCHCWFPPKNASGLIVLQPPERFTAIQRDWAHCMSAGFGIVVGDKRGPASYFSPSDVLRTTDLMLAQISSC